MKCPALSSLLFRPDTVSSTVTLPISLRYKGHCYEHANRDPESIAKKDISPLMKTSVKYLCFVSFKPVFLSVQCGDMVDVTTILKRVALGMRMKKFNFCVCASENRLKFI